MKPWCAIRCSRTSSPGIALLGFVISLPADARQDMSGLIDAIDDIASSNGIPPLAPPLPEIPPAIWEQYGWVLWIAIPLVVVLLSAVMWLAVRPGRPPVLPAPAAQATATLLALQSQPEDSATLGHVSNALRRYLTATFWLPPHEMTTQDFCSCLAARERIGPALAAALGEFLRSCDERKFAPGTSPLPLYAARKALELVEQAEIRRTAVGFDNQPPALRS